VSRPGRRIRVALQGLSRARGRPAPCDAVALGPEPASRRGRTLLELPCLSECLERGVAPFWLRRSRLAVSVGFPVFRSRSARSAERIRPDRSSRRLQLSFRALPPDAPAESLHSLLTSPSGHRNQTATFLGFPALQRLRREVSMRDEAASLARSPLSAFPGSQRTVPPKGLPSPPRRVSFAPATLLSFDGPVRLDLKVQMFDTSEDTSKVLNCLDSPHSN
jgi:hypothetical protein